METIKVQIGWSGDNYSALIEDINGVVVATGDTLEKVKEEIVSALEFHIEGSVEGGDELSQDILEGNYILEYHLLTSALLKQLDGLVTRSALSRYTNINERQLGHYIQGKKEAREATRQKVLAGVNKIRENLSQVV